MKFVPAGLSRAIGMQKLKVKTNSPTILLAAGIVGTVTTTVLASRATLKAQPIMEATHLELDKLEYDVAKAQDETGIRMSEVDIRKRRLAIYANTGVQLSKLYAPAFVVGSLSIGALVGSHKILSDRYSNLAAAYVSLQEGFAAYRKRVAEQIGDREEKELYHDVQKSEQLVNTPNGPKKMSTKVPGDGGGSPYAALFNRENHNWRDRPEYNVMFLRQVEEHCNMVLRTQGYMFLNRVYEELGLPSTEAGAVCGWLYERGTGDNTIDFGIWDDDMKSRFYDFMVGNEDEIMLDFNCDGEIYKKLSLPKVHRR